MSFSVYDVIVPVMINGLNVMDDYIDYAKEFADKAGWSEEQILNARLASDMLSLAEQISVQCNKVEAHVAKLLNRDLPEPRKVDLTYALLKARIAETKGFLNSLRPDDLLGADNRTYSLTPPIVRGWFGGTDYILQLVLPDFFFHIAIVHAILRHFGASVGKRTYLGRLSQESGGSYT